MHEPTARDPAKSPMIPSARISWIDSAKGVGIILVVIGHVCGAVLDGALVWFIFLFHMPLFFILSGYLMKAEPAGRSLERKARSLLTPYFIFLFGFGAALVLRDAVHHRPWSPELLDLAYGGARLVANVGPYWFITCLFIAQVMFAALLNRVNEPFSLPMLTFVAACLCGSYLLAGYTGPWAVGVVPFALVMLWVGYAFRRVSVSSRLMVPIAALVAIALLGGASGFTMDMKHAVYGPPVLGATLAVALSILVIEAARAADSWPWTGKLLRWLGSGSLIVMFLHQPVHFAVQGFIGSEWVVALIATAAPMAAFELIKRSPFLSMVLLARQGDGAAARLPAIASAAMRRLAGL